MKLSLAATFLLASSAISAIGKVGAFLVPSLPPSSSSSLSTAARRTKTVAVASPPLFRSLSSSALSMSAVEEVTEKKGETFE